MMTDQAHSQNHHGRRSPTLKSWPRRKRVDERFARNSAWLQRHATEIYTQYRGKCICVAGEELFVADTPEEVLAQARTAHPEEKGSILIRYIPREKVARIYAY